MELTLENLMNEIIEEEYVYNLFMNGAKKSFGEDSDCYKCFRSKWASFYSLALKFNFVDKLKR